MSSDKLTHLRRAADLTSTMLQMAEAEQWSGLPEYQQKRTSLLEQSFPLDDPQQTEACRELIATMVEQNRQLEQLCRDARQALQTELSGLNKNRKAVAAYQSN